MCVCSFLRRGGEENAGASFDGVGAGEVVADVVGGDLSRMLGDGEGVVGLG